METATERFRSQLAPKPIPFARPTSSDGSFSEESFNEDEVVDDLDRLDTSNNGSLNDSGMSLIHPTFPYDSEDFVYDDCMGASCDCEDGFRSGVARVAQRTCLSVDDEVVESLMEMWLPLVCEEAKETEGPLEDVGNFGSPPQMPLAKLTAVDDDEQLQSEGEEEESIEEENRQLYERAEDGASADLTGMQLVTASHHLSGMEDCNPTTSIEGLDPIVHGHPHRSLVWDELQKNKANCRANALEILAEEDAYCSPAVIRQHITENSGETCIQLPMTSSLENRSEGSDKLLAGPITEKSVGKQPVLREIISVDATDAVPAEVVNVKNELQSIGRLHITVSLTGKSKHGQLQVHTKNIYPSSSTLTEVHLKEEAEAFSLELVASAVETQLKPDDNSLVERIQSERVEEPMENIVKVDEDIVSAKQGTSEDVKSMHNGIAKQYRVDKEKEICDASFRDLEPKNQVAAEGNSKKVVEEADNMQEIVMEPRYGGIADKNIIVAVQEAGHTQEKTNAKENMEAMQAQSSNAASMEQDKFSFNMESKLPVADGDAGAEVQDHDTVMSDASDGVDVVDDLARKDIEANIECMCLAGLVQENIDVKEDVELMQSQASHAVSREQDKCNLHTKSKFSVADGDAGAKVQDYDSVASGASNGVDVVDYMARKNIEVNTEYICPAGQEYETVQSDASDGVDVVENMARMNIKENIECMCFGGQDAMQKEMHEEAMNLDIRSSYKFESSSGTDRCFQEACRKLVTDLDVEANDTNCEKDEDIGASSVFPLFFQAINSAEIQTNNASLGAAGLSVSTSPASLVSSVSSVELDPHSVQDPQKNGPVLSLPSAEDSQCNMDQTDSNEDTQEKLQMIRMKFLRLAHRLGQTSHNAVVAQVLYRLGLAEQLLGARCSERDFAINYDRVCAIAEEEEAAGQEGLDFACTILVLGKTGVGKSATINSIFGEAKTATNAFQPATNKIEDIVGTVCGVKVRIIDTPGLRPCFSDKRRNEKIMSSVEKFIKKCQPDIVLYCDRLDMQCRDHSDISLMQIITKIFGAAIWFNTTVVLTHSFLSPPDGADGSPISFEMFVAQRSHFVQQSIRQAAGDMRLMNPVSLIENHASCRTNRAGEKVLPNGKAWKPQLLLLCFASKILGEANAVLKLQDSIPGRQLGVSSRLPPLPYLLSSLLQSRAGPKIQDEQLGAQVVSDEDLEDLLDLEDGDDYDQLPPFKHLSKYQLSKLSKVQRKAYFDELDYREKLFQKKQWKEEKIRWKNLKSMSWVSKDTLKATDENFGEENGSAGAVPVPMPDMALPPSFDSDNPTYRYRYFDTSSQWLVRPVMEANGWDHDTGFNGLSVEKMFAIGDRIPASVSGQLNKDKKEANIQLECAASLRHPEGKVTLVGFDVQTVGKDQACTFRGETTFCKLKRNKTMGAFALTVLGDTLAAGMKLEDRLSIGKRLKFVLNGGAMMGHGEVAFGGTLEATLREKEYPIGQMLTTLGFSMMDWQGDLAIGSNLRSQILLGRKLMMVTHANLNNRGSGHINIRTNSSEQLQIALIGIIPIIRAVIGEIRRALQFAAKFNLKKNHSIVKYISLACGFILKR